MQLFQRMSTKNWRIWFRRWAIHIQLRWFVPSLELLWPIAQRTKNGTWNLVSPEHSMIPVPTKPSCRTCGNLGERKAGRKWDSNISVILSWKTRQRKLMVSINGNSSGVFLPSGVFLLSSWLRIIAVRPGFLGCVIACLARDGDGTCESLEFWFRSGAGFWGWSWARFATSKSVTSLLCPATFCNHQITRVSVKWRILPGLSSIKAVLSYSHTWTYLRLTADQVRSEYRTLENQSLGFSPQITWTTPGPILTYSRSTVRKILTAQARQSGNSVIRLRETGQFSIKRRFRWSGIHRDQKLVKNFYREMFWFAPTSIWTPFESFRFPRWILLTFLRLTILSYLKHLLNHFLRKRVCF